MIHATLLALSMLSAAPDGLHQATQALDDLNYDGALKLLPPEAAIQAWRREEVVEWFSTRALSLLGLKREAEAAETFRRLFSIAPEYVLPDQYGPKVLTQVAIYRADAAKSGTLSLRFEAGLLRVTVDATGLARQLEVSWREPNGPVKTVSLPVTDRQPAPWPRESRLDVWARLVGLEGSTLTEWGTENAPTRVEPLTVVVVSRPLGTWGLVGLGAGAGALVAAGLGTGFALGSQDAERAAAGVTRDAEGRITSLTQREAFALDTRARADAGAATGLFVTAAVLAAAGVGLVVFDRLSVVPAAGGAGLVVPLDAHFGFAGVEARR